MRDDDLTEYFSTLQTAFLRGQFSDLAKFFALPLVVYTQAGVLVIRDTAELFRLSEQYRAALIAIDVISTRTIIETIEQPVVNRRRIVVRFEDLGLDGRPVTRSLIRYFLVNDQGVTRIEMMEYIETPLPIADVERIVH